jgi:hypothetical protein
MIFEILVGMSLLWIAWLVSSMMDITVREKKRDEDAHRRRVRSKT